MLAVGILLVLSFELVLWAVATRPGLLPRGVAAPETLAVLFALLLVVSRVGGLGARFARPRKQQMGPASSMSNRISD